MSEGEVFDGPIVPEGDGFRPFYIPENHSSLCECPGQRCDALLLDPSSLETFPEEPCPGVLWQTVADWLLWAGHEETEQLDTENETVTLVARLGGMDFRMPCKWLAPAVSEDGLVELVAVISEEFEAIGTEKLKEAWERSGAWGKAFEFLADRIILALQEGWKPEDMDLVAEAKTALSLSRLPNNDTNAVRLVNDFHDEVHAFDMPASERSRAGGREADLERKTLSFPVYSKRDLQHYGRSVAQHLVVYSFALAYRETTLEVVEGAPWSMRHAFATSVGRWREMPSDRRRAEMEHDVHIPAGCRFSDWGRASEKITRKHADWWKRASRKLAGVEVPDRDLRCFNGHQKQDFLLVETMIDGMCKTLLVHAITQGRPASIAYLLPHLVTWIRGQLNRELEKREEAIAREKLERLLSKH